MRKIEADEAQQLAAQVLDQVTASGDFGIGVPDSWNREPAGIYIDGNKLIFECVDEADAERVLGALYVIIAG